MLSLEDSIWRHLDGGYRIPYKPISALRKLEPASMVEGESAAYKELWGEGGLGGCSYARVPQLVRIAESNTVRIFVFFSLTAVIEIERHRTSNPVLPEFIQEVYSRSLSRIPSIIALRSLSSWDGNTVGFSMCRIRRIERQPDFGVSLSWS